MPSCVHECMCPRKRAYESCAMYSEPSLKRQECDAVRITARMADTSHDEQLARELSEELAAGDDEVGNLAAARALSARLDAEESVFVQAKIFCISELVTPMSSGLFCTEVSKLIGAIEETPQVRVAVAVASNGKLVATESTELVAIDDGRASWNSSQGELLSCTLPKSSLQAPTTLCFTLFVASGDDGCCTAVFGHAVPLASQAQPFSSTSLLPLSSRDGTPADWLDDTPRDHYLDDGTILTLSAAVITFTGPSGN